MPTRPSFLLHLLLPVILTFTTLPLSRGGEPPYYYPSTNPSNPVGNTGSMYPQGDPGRSRYQNVPGNRGRVYSNGASNSYDDVGPVGNAGQSWNRYQEPASSRGGYGSQRYPQSGGMGMGQQQPQNEFMEIERMCSKHVSVGQNEIIDIQTSVQYGAQLLDGMYAHSFESCVATCCQYDGCDLALYKMDGVSQTGKTCYFVHCGLPDHCKMVPNTGFQSGFLVSNSPNYGDILDSRPVDDTDYNSPHSSSEPPTRPTIHHLPSTSTPSQEPSQPPTTPEEDVATPPDKTDDGSKPVDTSGTAPPFKQPSTPATDSPGSISPDTNPGSSTSVVETDTPPTNTTATTEPSTADSGNKGHTGSGENPTINTSDTSTSSSGPATGTSASTPATKAETNTNTGINGGQEKRKKISRKKDCGRDGCDGGGLIAVTVVGSLIIVMLLVVAVVVGRKIYKIKRRKKYRNVDYLINGMYT